MRDGCTDDNFSSISGQGRLIGFSVITSQGYFGSLATSIRSIQPIFDNIDCADTTFYLSLIEAASPFSIVVGAGSVSFTMQVPDLYS